MCMWGFYCANNEIVGAHPHTFVVPIDDSTWEVTLTAYCFTGTHYVGDLFEVPITLLTIP
jgi:hypothetical protein